MRPRPCTSILARKHIWWHSWAIAIVALACLVDKTALVSMQAHKTDPPHRNELSVVQEQPHDVAILANCIECGTVRMVTTLETKPTHLEVGSRICRRKDQTQDKLLGSQPKSSTAVRHEGVLLF